MSFITVNIPKYKQCSKQSNVVSTFIIYANLCWAMTHSLKVQLVHFVQQNTTRNMPVLVSSKQMECCQRLAEDFQRSVPKYYF